MSEEVNIKDKITENRKKNYFKPFILFSILLVFSLFFIPSAKGFDIKELLPVKHNVFVKGPNMHVFHNGPATLLNDGNVLVIGGKTKKSEIYDYKKNKFIFTKGEMNYIRQFGATATTLKDGRVLITGGYNKDNKILDKVNHRVFFENKLYFTIPPKEEIYNPNTGLYTPIENMCVPRINHNAFLMKNGNVILIGGIDNKISSIQNPHNPNVLEIEEFNPITNTFKIILTLDTPQDNLTSFKLNDDKILIIAGVITSRQREVIIYDYKTNKAEKYKPKESNILNSKGNVEFVNAKSVFIDDETLLIMSNKNRVILFDTKNNSIEQVIETDIYRNQDYSLTELSNGNAILIGGSSGSDITLRELENTLIFDTNKKEFIKNSAKLNSRRTNHIAIRLLNGNILIFGGYKNAKDNELLSSEIYYQ